MEDRISEVNRLLEETKGAIKAIESLQDQNISEIQAFKHQSTNMNEGFSAISESVSSLFEKSGEIKQIINLITRVASQTNILAINASIEAARAGEHGRAFTVVADEVKKLSVQTSNSASNIQTLVDKIQSEIIVAKNSIDEINQSLGGLQFEDTNIEIAYEKEANEASGYILEELKRSFNPDSAKANPGSYLSGFQKNIERICEAGLRKFKDALGTCFYMDGSFDKHLKPDDFAVGIYCVWQEGKLDKQNILYVKDMKQSNEYLAWFYAPIRAKKGVWSKVSYDPFAKKELVSYTVPFYVNSELIGVIGVDFDYELYRHKNQKEALSKAMEGIGQLSEYAKNQ